MHTGDANILNVRSTRWREKLPRLSAALAPAAARPGHQKLGLITIKRETGAVIELRVEHELPDERFANDLALPVRVEA